MAKSRGIIQSLFTFRDQNLNVQMDNIIGAVRLFPFLGVLATDPTTTGWGVGDICFWVNNGTNTACVIKYWDGDGVKTVTAT